jgi:hypothetical protein
VLLTNFYYDVDNTYGDAFFLSPCLSDKWCEMFAHFTKQDISAESLKCLVSFCLALPGCNAAVERVFSLLNALWTDEKVGLKMETVETLTIVKTHFIDFSCAESKCQKKKKKKTF